MLTVVTAALAGISVGSRFGLSAEAYTSLPMITLWVLTASAALLYIFQRRLGRRPVVAGLHLSFILILLGGLTTHLTATETSIRLRTGEAVEASADLPFAVTLERFDILTYAGTDTPRDFVCRISDGGAEATDVSMNRPGELHGYKFLAKTYDSDGGGMSFTISSDKCGTGITYAGYLLLAICFVAYFFNSKSQWRAALRRLSVIAVLLTAASAKAAVTDEFTDSLAVTAVSYNGRICPVATMARDFTATLTGGSASYKSHSAMDVLCGFLFDFSNWKREPIIRVKDAELRNLLGCDGRYASYDDFFRAATSGQLDVEDPAVKHRYSGDIDRFEAVNMLVSGELIKIFPVASADDDVTWYSPIDRLPAELNSDQWMFIRKYLGLLNEQIQRSDSEQLQMLLGALHRYQRKVAGDTMPSPAMLKAEVVYVGLTSPRWPAVAVAAIGLILFIVMAARRISDKHIRFVGTTLSSFLFAALTALIIMRWIVGGHVPMSNGYETMQFLAWCLLLITLVFNRFVILPPTGLLASGLALSVAAMSGAGATVTGLMPVLNSPLLSIHVALVMGAYALFFLMALTGMLGLINRRDGERLATLNTVMLYPALALLTCGIFVGAVWANVSLGRYWGWDPKEVWALITMLIYSLAAHPGSLPMFGKPQKFNAFTVIAFISVLITYFGVNFFLGGLHSYA